jgi:hypothetical protein
MPGRGMSSTAQHEQAVAQTLGWAQEAAGRDDFEGALAWLAVVETVDGFLSAEWERTRASWLHRKRPADGSREPAACGPDAALVRDWSRAL